MRNLLLLLLPLSLLAQPVITPSGPATATAGSSVNVTVSASATSGSGLNSVGFTLALSSSMSISGSPVSNQSAGGIFGQCASITSICFVGGFDAGHGTANINPIGDGALVTIPVQIANSAAPGTVSISISNLLGASGALSIGGVATPVTAGPAYSLKILSRCDTNSDGAVNIADIQAAITAYLTKSACPIAGDTCGPAVIESVITSSLGGACGA